MLPLSQGKAAQCENAKSPARQCRCRCGGALHGVARGAVQDLPDEDPHAAGKRDPRRDPVPGDRLDARSLGVLRVTERLRRGRTTLIGVDVGGWVSRWTLSYFRRATRGATVLERGVA